MPLNKVDLPAPFGPTTASERAGLDRAVEMMHGRMALVAERQIVKAHAHRLMAQRVAQKNAAQISAISAPATASRCGAESRSSDGEIAGDGCGAPPWW